MKRLNDISASETQAEDLEIVENLVTEEAMEKMPMRMQEMWKMHGEKKE